MARIRTIKPAFFRHEKLFEAEVEERLPLRITYAGLFTVADREGRFRWQPRVLKLDILPFDEIDFAAVLDALERHGFIVKYTVDGEIFGHIPTFSKHQHINQREAESEIPAPDEADARTKTHVRAYGERKGREQEGKGITLPPAGAVRDDVGEIPAALDRRLYSEDFESLWRAYRPIASPNSTKADAATAFKRLSAADKAACHAGLLAYVDWIAAERRKRSDTPAKHLASFINKRGWEPFLEDEAQVATQQMVWLATDNDQFQRAAGRRERETGKRTPTTEREGKRGWYFPAEYLGESVAA